MLASALLRVASSVVIGATTRARLIEEHDPDGLGGVARPNERPRGLRSRSSSATPFIESLVSITSTVPKCDCSIFEAGSTDRPWTGTPLFGDRDLAGGQRRRATRALSRNARCGNVGAARLGERRAPDAHACDGRQAASSMSQSEKC